MPLDLGRDRIENEQKGQNVNTISVRNPWALWISWGWKSVVTRTRKDFRSLVGKRIAIHAGKLLDPKAFSLADPCLLTYQKERTLIDMKLAMSQHRRKITDPRFGSVICTAFAEKHRILTVADEPLALCDCAGLWGLFLRDVQVLSKPIPWQGRLFALMFRTD